jgi:uncharacterized membrane protein YeaQ/YmgE (transglycosylase-associated protein family)
MPAETLLIWLVIGAVAGWLAGTLVKGGGFGLLGDIVVGIIGAFIAGWLFPKVGFHLATGMYLFFMAAIFLVVLAALIATFSAMFSASPR